MGRCQEFEECFDNAYEEVLPQELVETYDIVECLSCVEGCDTLLVKQKKTGKKMVAKCYTLDNMLFEQEEVLTIKNIKCKTVPNFGGEFRNEKCRCVLREYIDGVSLNQFAKDNRLTEEQMVDIAIELAKIMKMLHRSQPTIIHRDIKPQNIIVRKDGGLALIDFGISRVFKKDGTQDTHFCGTAAFAPPEQYGFMQTDIRSDIYSFGMVLSWMITGKTRPIRKPLTRLEWIAAKCCRFSPDRRYQSDEALLRDLRRTTRAFRARAQKRKTCCIAFLIMFTAVYMCAGCIPFSGKKVLQSKTDLKKYFF
ncbi:MAG: serine/threonine-protein kinase [Agathobacter sp.]